VWQSPKQQGDCHVALFLAMTVDNWYGAFTRIILYFPDLSMLFAEKHIQKTSTNFGQNWWMFFCTHISSKPSP